MDVSFSLDWLAEKPIKVHLADDVEFHQLYYCIQQQQPYSYLFESLALPRHQDRYHTAAFDPALLFTATGRQLTVSGKRDYLRRFGAHQQQLVVDQNAHSASSIHINCANPYRYLQSLFPHRHNVDTHLGGLIGFASYESVNYFEETINLPEDTHFPPFIFGLFLDGLLFDTTTGSLFYYSYAEDRRDYVLDLLGAYQQQPIPKQVPAGEFLGHSETQQEFTSYVERTRQKIAAGYSFQAEVGFKSFFNISGDKFIIYNRLRQVNPSPYMYYLAFAELTLLGASPEILVSMKNGRILTTPTAGTIVRGKTEMQDRTLARQLLNDPKEIAEHNMLVDLHRNDIARVSKPGSVVIDDLMYIIKFSHVQHIVSNVVGQVATDKDSFDVLATMLPGGVVSGAPKIETIKIIAENESLSRGPYGGAVGRFSFNGDCDFCLPIRSVFCNADHCFAQTSAGVVFDSIAAKEFKEVLAKLGAMTQTLKELGVKHDL